MSVFEGPLPYLAALRTDAAPVAVVLDWRLERQLSAATHERRRAQLQQAIAEVDRRVAETNAAPQR